MISIRNYEELAITWQDQHLGAALFTQEAGVKWEKCPLSIQITGW